VQRVRGAGQEECRAHSLQCVSGSLHLAHAGLARTEEQTVHVGQFDSVIVEQDQLQMHTMTAQHHSLYPVSTHPTSTLHCTRETDGYLPNATTGQHLCSNTANSAHSNHCHRELPYVLHMDPGRVAPEGNTRAARNTDQLVVKTTHLVVVDNAHPLQSHQSASEGESRRDATATG